MKNTKDPLIPSTQKHIYRYMVDAHGNWFCEGNPVTDKELLKILGASIFEREGRYYIRCEGEIHPVEVEDAPLWVKYLHIRHNPNGEIEAIDIELTDGRREPLRPETMWIEGESGLYCLATRKNLKTRFGKIAYYELANNLTWQEGVYKLSVKGRNFIVPVKQTK